MCPQLDVTATSFKMFQHAHFAIVVCIHFSRNSTMYQSLTQQYDASIPHAIVRCINPSRNSTMHQSLTQQYNVSIPHAIVRCINPSRNSTMYQIVRCINTSTTSLDLHTQTASIYTHSLYICRIYQAVFLTEFSSHSLLLLQKLKSLN